MDFQRLSSPNSPGCEYRAENQFIRGRRMFNCLEASLVAAARAYVALLSVRKGNRG